MLDVPDDQDALVNVLGSLPERMFLALMRIERGRLLRVVVWRDISDVELRFHPQSLSRVVPVEALHRW
jgi:hypothetical protein